jgi:hypothetical protein
MLWKHVLELSFSQHTHQSEIALKELTFLTQHFHLLEWTRLLVLIRRNKPRKENHGNIRQIPKEIHLCPIAEDEARSPETEKSDVASELKNREFEQESRLKNMAVLDPQPTFTDAAEDQRINEPAIAPWWHQHVFTESARRANQSRITSETPKQRRQTTT